MLWALVGGRSDRGGKVGSVLWVLLPLVFQVICDMVDDLQMLKAVSKKKMNMGVFCLDSRVGLQEVPEGD